MRKSEQGDSHNFPRGHIGRSSPHKTAKATFLGVTYLCLNGSLSTAEVTIYKYEINTRISKTMLSKCIACNPQTGWLLLVLLAESIRTWYLKGGAPKVFSPF